MYITIIFKIFKSKIIFAKKVEEYNKFKFFVNDSFLI